MKPKAPIRIDTASELPLEEGLREFAAEGVSTLFYVAVAFAIVAAVAGLALTAWSLRPIPEYSSHAIENGSPFDAVFRVHNGSTLFALGHPRIRCVLTYVGEAEAPPVTASNVLFLGGEVARIGPDQAATFRCPFRSEMQGGLPDDDLAKAMRTELIFRLAYDLPFGMRWTERSGPYVIDTQRLPPRWQAKQ